MTTIIIVIITLIITTRITTTANFQNKALRLPILIKKPARESLTKIDSSHL